MLWENAELPIHGTREESKNQSMHQRTQIESILEVKQTIPCSNNSIWDGLACSVLLELWMLLLLQTVGRETAIAQQCSAWNWALADNFNPLESSAVAEWSDIIPSSIITTTHRQHTVAFVGTQSGELVKVSHFKVPYSSMICWLYDRLSSCLLSVSGIMTA